MKYKFRAWDKERREMRRVALMDWSDWWVSTGRTRERDQPHEYGERNSFGNEETDRHILMQYSLVNDDDGNEIYEGDVIEIGMDSPPYIEVVVFENGSFRTQSENELISDIMDKQYGDGCRVIGNIHQHEVDLYGVKIRRFEEIPKVKIESDVPAMNAGNMLHQAEGHRSDRNA